MLKDSTWVIQRCIQRSEAELARTREQVGNGSPQRLLTIADGVERSLGLVHTVLALLTELAFQRVSAASVDTAGKIQSTCDLRGPLAHLPRCFENPEVSAELASRTSDFSHLFRCGLALSTPVVGIQSLLRDAPLTCQRRQIIRGSDRVADQSSGSAHCSGSEVDCLTRNAVRVPIQLAHPGFSVPIDSDLFANTSNRIHDCLAFSFSRIDQCIRFSGVELIAAIPLGKNLIKVVQGHIF